jgi:hypothetical protein
MGRRFSSIAVKSRPKKNSRECALSELGFRVLRQVGDDGKEFDMDQRRIEPEKF